METKGIVLKSIASDRLRKIVWIIQYVLIAIIIFTILQIIFGSFYFTNLLSLSTAISYGLTIVLMCMLMWRFLIWFKRSRNLALLLYACAAGTVAINGVFSIILFDVILMEKPQTRQEFKNGQEYDISLLRRAIYLSPIISPVTSWHIMIHIHIHVKLSPFTFNQVSAKLINDILWSRTDLAKTIFEVSVKRSMNYLVSIRSKIIVPMICWWCAMLR